MPVADTELLQGFGVLQRTYVRYVSQAIQTIPISFSDSVFLVNIGQREGIAQEEIANMLAIDRAAVARSVKHMYDNGYIAIQKSARNMRIKHLYLTDQGKELYQRLQAINSDWLNHVFGSMNDAQIQQFRKTIATLRERANLKTIY